MRAERKLNRQRLIGATAIIFSSAVFIVLLSLFISSKIQETELQKRVEEAKEELQEVLNQSQKLQDDEYYQLYYYDDPDHILTSGDKVIIDFSN